MTRRTTAAPLAALLAELRAGSLAPGAVVESALDRLELLDGELATHLAEAGRARRLRAAVDALETYPAGARPPLFGVPLAVKDIFRVAGLPTRAGSSLPAELFTGPEAACVSRLCAAGALVLGKARTTEFAMLDPGPTRNPHAPEHTPGGSSSGSAAAVAAGIVPLAIGSQTTGSVIRPAAFCGVVGFKPSYGRIPTEGMLHCSPTVDTVGTFTQDVAGMAAAAAVMLDRWDAARFSAPASGALVLGVPEGPFLECADAEGRDGFERSLAALAAAGHRLVRSATFDDFEELCGRHGDLVAAEFAAEHEAWYRDHSALYRPCAAGLVERGRAVDADTLERARRSPSELRARLHAALDAEALDAWVSPSACGPAPRGIEATGNPVMNLPWTHAGLPTVSLPAGRASNGLPLGLQVSGRFDADEELLRTALLLEPILADAR